ncbi:MAG TPA: TetR/AcrR family transcriptional regulator [Baekduia sp.]|uniref:TetR/AcrR family transcriptional regulator n=1 Tax=Baekduia sp. TaxID=2600305 RepID=UPI002D785D8D|nr:TetR/AcrR family transcriptional regulator [Baekduia sp.]HET6505869.1 TetR/AcrR family transcriptional regulator [Baekduia sp.]
MERGAAVDAAEPPRARLDRERILDAAEAIVHREGVGRLTMRRIGTELGSDPTAIYRHFRGKDELLVQLADRLFGTEIDVDPALPWREQMKIELRHAMYRYRSHPELARLLAVQPDDTPSLQRIAERNLQTLTERGLSDAQAAMMFQVIENHVVGTGLYYAHVEDADDPRLRDPGAMRRAYALLPADRFPNAVRAAAHLFPDLDAAYDFGSDLILDAIERLVAQGGDEPGSTSTDGVPTP